MDFLSLISALEEKQILIQTAGNRLTISGRKENLSPDLVEAIKHHKATLVEHLMKRERTRKNNHIRPVEKREYYDLSHAQRRLWVIDQFKESQGAYNIPSTYYIRGKIDHAAFEKAFHTLAARHESLLTTFIIVDGEPRQRIHELNRFPLDIQWSDERERGDQEAFIRECCKEESAAPFNLEEGPLFRVRMIRLEDEKYLFIFNIHHIISDGWSSQVFTREILYLYYSTVRGSGGALSPLRIQYKDYAFWQNAQLQGESLKKMQGYWQSQFSDEIPQLSFPLDFQRPPVKTYKGSSQSIVLDPEVTQSLQAFSQQHGATLFMTLLALLKTLLYRYTGQSDVIVGSPVAGRNHQDLESQVGLYVNTLALRTRFSSDTSFEQLLERVKETTLNAYDNQVYPFDRLVEDLNIARDLSRNPLFDMIVNFQSATDRPQQSAQQASALLRFEHLENEITSSKFDLTFNFLETPSDIEFSILYNTDLFRQGRIERFLVHFKKLAIDAMANPGKMVSALDYVPALEREKVIQAFNNTTATYPADKTVTEIFAEQVALYPDAEAIRFGELRLTYREFDEITTRAAHYLRNRFNIQPDDRIALISDRTHLLMISIWSVLKAGACYVPIDPSFPEERIRFVLEDTAARAVIINTGRELEAWPSSCPSVKIGDVLAAAAEEKQTPLSRINKPNDLLYIIYTSGSTGKPKGVMITHRNVIARVKNAGYYSFAPSDRALLVGNYTFDVSILDIIGPLLNGGSVSVARLEDVQMVKPLADIVLSQGITHMSIATALFNTLMDVAPECISGMKKVYFGGEEASRKHIEIALAHAPGVAVNIYGPTETTVLATVFECKDLHDRHYKVPIGSPVSNTYVLILDERHKPVPIGISGELYIGGDGVGRGYLNRDELTAERFIEDPLTPGKQVYKTGDIGRWLSDGSIHFEGRKDGQVKIRGFRIELGEVENALLSVFGIGEVAVIVKGDTTDSRYIAAYYTATAEDITEEKIKAALLKRLPEYMLPSAYVKMQKFPLNTNGKIDRKVLPDPAQYLESKREAYVAPQTDLQQKLHAIWCGVLGKEKISITDNFFTIGGHSLKATKLILLITSQLEADLGLRDIFAFPTIESLAACIAAKERSAYAAIAALGGQEHYALSHAQKRLWILDQMEDKLTAYNIPGAYYLNGPLDAARLERALQTMIRRHEVLRTTFIKVDGEPRQKIHSPESAAYFTLEQTDLRGYADRDVRSERMAAEEARQSFNLARGPLLKATLVRLEEERHLFIFTIHHILADGWSVGIIAKEIITLYHALLKGVSDSLQPLRIQYKDYAAWQNAAGLDKSRAYWLEQMAAPLPVLDLPCDFERPLVKSYEGASASHIIAGDKLHKIRAFCREHDCTTFMYLVAAWNALFFKYTGQSDLIIGSPAAGRNHPDLDNQIGFYVNTLALRTQFSPDDSITKLIDNVKRTVIGAYDHQAYPFDMLVDELNLERDMARTPLFDVMIAYQRQSGASDMPASTLKVEPFHTGSGTSKFDLTVNIFEAENALIFSTDFATRLFKNETIDRMHGHLDSLITAMLADAAAPLKSLDYIPEDERFDLLENQYKVNPGYIVTQTIVEMFDDAAVRFADRIAASHKGRSFTFRELHQKSNALAHTLMTEYGIGRNSIVPVLLERTLDMPVALWAILKAGASFVPLDPQWPAERLKDILDDTCATLLITNCESWRDRFAGVRQYWISADTLPCRTENVTVPSGLEDPIYAFYTSGSTGKPKGALNKHLGIANRFLYMTHHYKPAADDVVLFTSNYVFDAAIWQLMWPMTLGIKMVIPVADDFFDLRKILDVIAEEQVTITHFVPSVLNVLVDTLLQQPELCVKLRSLRRVQVGGEAMSARHVQALLSMLPGITVVNDYGPTETSIGALFFDVPAGAALKTVPIGRPMDHVPVRIMDDHHNLVPRGVAGELWLGGHCVGLGYLNRPELTNKVFVSHDGQIFYRTGDQVRLLDDGNIEFLGRIDHQVKIRGYRIELEEIEALMMQHPGVRQAVVTVWNDGGEKYLAGYYVSDGLSAEQVRDFLSVKLPAYMVPEFLQSLEQLPLTTSGKVNRKALPKPLVNASAGVFTAAANETERKLKAIWDEILQTTEFGVTDNFFGLGGHSLKALQVQSRIVQAFEVDIRIRDIFMFPTIRLMAERVNALRGGGAEGKEAIPDTDLLIDLEIDTEDDSSIRLFCIPHGGGGKHVFEGLRRIAPAYMKIEALELPGRGERANETLPATADEMVNDLYDQIKGNLDRPYVLFGHSMGGLLAYLLTQKIIKEDALPPQHLFVSSCIAPRLYSKWNMAVDAESLKAVMQKDYNLEEGLLDYVTPILSSDIRAMTTYDHVDGKPLNIPLTLMKGSDELITEAQMHEWKNVTETEAALFTFSGGHFYLFGQEAAVMDFITDQLNQVAQLR